MTPRPESSVSSREMGMDPVVDLDLEKGIIKEAMGAPDAHQLPDMARGGEKEPMVPDPRVPRPIDGGVVVAANKMNPAGLKKWLPYWLTITGSGIVLTNLINAAPMKYQLMIPPELAAFMVFLCAICFMFRAMKQVM